MWPFTWAIMIKTKVITLILPAVSINNLHICGIKLDQTFHIHHLFTYVFPSRHTKRNWVSKESHLI